MRFNWQWHPESQFDWCLSAHASLLVCPKQKSTLISCTLSFLEHTVSAVMWFLMSHIHWSGNLESYYKKHGVCLISATSATSFYCLLFIFSGQWIKQVSVVSCFLLGGLHRAYRSSAVCWLTLLYANIPPAATCTTLLLPCLAFSVSHTHTHTHTCTHTTKHTRTSPRDSHGRAVKRKPRWLINSALVLIPPYWLSTAEIQIQSFAWIILPPPPPPPPPPQQLPPKTNTLPKYWGHVVTHAMVNACHWFLGRLCCSAESEVLVLLDVGFPLMRKKPLSKETGNKRLRQTLTDIMT